MLLLNNTTCHFFKSHHPQIIINFFLNSSSTSHSFHVPCGKYPQGFKYFWLAITNVKHIHIFRLWLLVQLLVQLLLSHLPMHSGKWGATEEKGRWCCTWNPSYIQGSNYFHAALLCLRWILRSQKWRISTFHPSYLLYVLFLLCHSRACVINLLSAHANGPFSRTGSSF